MNNEFSIDFKFAVKSPADAYYANLASDVMQQAPNPMSFACAESGMSYAARIGVRQFGGISLGVGEVEPLNNGDTHFICERSRSQIALNRSSEFFVFIWLGGEHTRLTTHGRESIARAGDFVITNTDSPFTAHVFGRSSACNLSLPASWDRIGDVQLESLLGRRFPRRDRHHNALVNYTQYLLSSPNALAFPGAAERLYDVIGLSLNPRAKSDYKTGLLALMQNYVKVHCANPELGPLSVAQMFGISVRYLHLLFSSCDTTFAEYLIEQRLTLAHRMLTDERFSKQTVMTIALDCGFQNSSHFGVRFRKRFGYTPTELRQSLVTQTSS